MYTPRYSDTPDASERILESTPSSSSTDSARAGSSLGLDFVYKTDHMIVNLGSRMWDLRMPAYGFEGHVEGCVRLLEDKAHVKSVEIKVERLPFGQNFGILTSLRCPAGW